MLQSISYDVIHFCSSYCILSRFYKGGHYSHSNSILWSGYSFQYCCSNCCFKAWSSIRFVYWCNFDICWLSVLLPVYISGSDDRRKQCTSFCVVLDDTGWTSINGNGQSVFSLHPNKGQPRMV